MSELGRHSRDILDSGRHLDEPTDEQRARVKRALFASVAAGVTATAATTGAAAAATPALPLAKLVLSVALVAGGVGGGVWFHARSRHAPAAVSAVSAPAAVTPPAPREAPAEVVPLPVTPPSPPARRRAPAPASGHLREEIGLLGDVNAALRMNDGHRALALLADYDARFPHGMLREEVQATRLIARCQLTPGSAAWAAARRFIDSHPASPLAPRVISSCRQER